MPRQPLASLILALGVAMAPLVGQLPLWAVLWCGVAWAYVLVREERNWTPLSRAVRMGLFIVALAAVLVSAGALFDGNDFITLLAVMAGIKPLEVNNRRDSMITVFLAYFLTITSLFVFDNLAMILYLFVSVWVSTAVLIHVNEPDGKIRGHLRLAARLVLVAIPMTAMLFILFPRLSSSFWGTPWTRQPHSGFSGTMRIGDVSRLALNDDPAFSVSFKSPVPRVNQLYWRGIVFQRFDGQTWQPTLDLKVRHQYIGGENEARYTVILEPHGYRYLFALELPTKVDPVAIIMEDHTLVTRRPVSQRLSYRAVSILDYRQAVTESYDPVTLDLPAGKNPMSLDLGRRWGRQYATTEEIVDAGLDFFRKNGFAYTLRPGRLGEDAIDDFLFTTRKGFCEHFAAGFAVLMRAAGVPARIVAGYQGGRWNALGDFFTVRQSDAHVWCEVWEKKRGWVRVDPTFIVAPERIDRGFEQALAQGVLEGDQVRGKSRWRTDWINRLEMTWEAVNIRWNMWFMGFSAEDQLALLRRLGISLGGQGRWLVVLVLPSLFILLFILARSLNSRGHRVSSRDQALKIYSRFLRKTARSGLPKAPYQGPQAYAAWISRMAPELTPDVDAITNLYITLRYARASKDAALKQLRQRVRRFRPGKFLQRKSGAGQSSKDD